MESSIVVVQNKKDCIQQDLAMQGVEQQVKEQSSYLFFVFMFISMECSGGRLGTSFPEHLGLYVHFQDGFCAGSLAESLAGT